MAESRNLVVINDGMVPTFPRGSSFLDLTLATPDIVQKIGSWEVLETESLSDHQYILYTLTSPKRTTRAARNGWAWRKLDIEKLDSFIANVRVPSTDDAKTSSVECNELLKGACDSCMPNGKYKWGKKSCYWWSSKIANIRKECMHKRRRLRKARQRGECCLQKLEDYRLLKRSLKIEIRQSKENSWQELCNQVETDPWGIPYKVATKKLIGRRPITGITIPGRLELIVDTLFPIHQPLIWPETEAPEEIPLITRQEVEPIARGLPGNKAPGPDGIPDIIVKHVILKRSELILGTLNKCLTQGIFPTPWKEATLVLLPKGNKPLDQPSSYRPICLLNTIGKVFERIIKKRLEAHLEVTRGISNHQFGFMKGRSTIDAIKMATNVIQEAGTGPLYKRQLCAMVCLDVANSFNSVSWVRIEEALVEKNVPAYLVLILRSYLSDRSLIYGENQRRAITSGMPGNIPGISSSTVIAFADDVAVLATGHTTALLEAAMNQSLEAVARWIADRGLTLSVSKTEAIMLTTKRGYTKPRFLLENTQLTLKEHVRYLGVEFSSKLGFGKHLECAAVKAKKTITSLSRLMPNIGGPKQRKRQLLMTVAQSQMLYAAPVWAPALRFEKNIRTLLSPQRLMAIRVACAYRTVSTNAINVVASMLPLKQMASERCAIYAAKQNGLTPPTKRELREQSIREWQKEWQASDTGTWTKRLIPDLQPWVTRSFGTLNYHLTQLLTGHGCFGEKLSKF
ncbi:hypothetical protein QTP88_022383 [Uroleucon formosanum]